MSPDEIDLVLFNRNTSIHLEEGINVLDQVLGQQLEQDLRHAQMKHLIKQEYLEDEIFNSGQSTPAQSPARSSGNESCSLTPRRVKGGHYDHYKDTSGKINLELVRADPSKITGSHMQHLFHTLARGKRFLSNLSQCMTRLVTKTLVILFRMQMF